MTSTTIFTYVYYQHTQLFFTTFIKTPHIHENMTIWPHDSTKDTGWGHTREPATAPIGIFLSPLNMNCCTFIIQFPTK